MKTLKRPILVFTLLLPVQATAMAPALKHLPSEAEHPYQSGCLLDTQPEEIVADEPDSGLTKHVEENSVASFTLKVSGCIRASSSQTPYVWYMENEQYTAMPVENHPDFDATEVTGMELNFIAKKAFDNTQFWIVYTEYDKDVGGLRSKNFTLFVTEEETDDDFCTENPTDEFCGGSDDDGNTTTDDCAGAEWKTHCGGDGMDPGCVGIEWQTHCGGTGIDPNDNEGAAPCSEFEIVNDTGVCVADCSAGWILTGFDPTTGEAMCFSNVDSGGSDLVPECSEFEIVNDSSVCVADCLIDQTFTGFDAAGEAVCEDDGDGGSSTESKTCAERLGDFDWESSSTLAAGDESITIDVGNYEATLVSAEVVELESLFIYHYCTIRFHFEETDGMGGTQWEVYGGDVPDPFVHTVQMSQAEDQMVETLKEDIRSAVASKVQGKLWTDVTATATDKSTLSLSIMEDPMVDDNAVQASFYLHSVTIQLKYNALTTPN